MRSIDGPKAPLINKQPAPKEEPAKGYTRGKGFIKWELKTIQEDVPWYWYLGLGIVVTIPVAYFAWQRDWFPIGIIIFATGAFLWNRSHTQKDRVIDFEINRNGVAIDGRDYPYPDLHSFWVNNQKQKAILNLFLVKKYLPAIQLDITEADGQIIKSLLNKKIPEQERRSENLIDALTRILRL